MPEPEKERGFLFRGLCCRPDPKQTNAFYYKPGFPTPERDPLGRPVLILWLGAAGTRLQLGAKWAAEPEALDALRSEVLRRFPERKLSPSAVVLLPEQVSVDRVSLELGDGAGVFRELQKSRASGFPPYSAIFNTPLTAEQAALVGRALSGCQGCLRVTYRGTFLRRPGEPPAPLESSADISVWFPAGSGSGHIRSIPS